MPLNTRRLREQRTDMNRQQDFELNRRRVDKAARRGMSISGSYPSDISRQLGISRNTVYRWLNRWEEEGYLGDRPRLGGPKATTREQDRSKLSEAEGDHFMNAKALREQLHL